MLYKLITTVFLTLCISLSSASSLLQAKSGMDSITESVKAAKTAIDAYNGGIMGVVSVANAIFKIHESMQKSHAMCEQLEKYEEEEFEVMRASFSELQPAVVDMLATVSKKVGPNYSTGMRSIADLFKAMEMDNNVIQLGTAGMMNMFFQKSRAYQDMMIQKMPKENLTAVQSQLSEMDDAFHRNIMALQ
ncbi:hypothetical protein IFM51744_10504 [Aspergillus udagawae]|nr:hypothetical protein IFM51744_10504 [Aspergillus udagawae]